jgi:hypothetical protein
MALAAAEEALGPGPWELAEVDFPELSTLPQDHPLVVQLVLAPGAGGGATFDLSSHTSAAGPGDGPWTLNATGKIRRGGTSADR